MRQPILSANQFSTNIHRLRLGQEAYRIPMAEPFSDCVLFSCNGSLSDLVILSAISASARENGLRCTIQSNCRWFSQAMGFHPWYMAPQDLQLGLSMHRAIDYWYCGHGHIIQRLQRFIGAPVSVIPKGRFLQPHPTVKGRVFYHFVRKKWAHGFHKPLAAETMNMLQEWMRSRSDLEFVTFSDGGFAGLMEDIGSSEFYLGIPTGPMHLAAACGKKCITLVNSIRAADFILPVEFDVCSPDLIWFYPHHVHLHESDSSKTLLAMTPDNLNKAVAGEIAPGWLPFC